MVVKIRYFTYPEAAALELSPRDGPKDGGSIVELSVKDYEGPYSRAAAGLPTICGAYLKDFSTQILFSASKNVSSVLDFNITSGFLQDDMTRIYKINFIQKMMS